MQFKFTKQQYQLDAIKNTLDVFKGQRVREQKAQDANSSNDSMLDFNESGLLFGDVFGSNAPLSLSDEELLRNINVVQNRSLIPPSHALSKDPYSNALVLDIEMETGTGKTYVYISTMFELNRLFGWSNFIVVVPSIAIREGVIKSFEILTDHLMAQYQKKARFFAYDSNSLQDLYQFASKSDAINVMIINYQAFATQKEDAKSEKSRIIYTERDDFASRRPIDMIADTRPILILDEPQRLSGKATMEGLTRFNPLFMLNYSATHVKRHNTIYSLDAVDAFKHKLVKRIEIVGFDTVNRASTNLFMKLEDVVINKTGAPSAKILVDVSISEQVHRKSRKFNVGDDLYKKTKLEQYKGCVITDIDAISKVVRFTEHDDLTMETESEDLLLLDLQRKQIRETIAVHFEKEFDLFKRNIKTLSLFFIDKVVKYRSNVDEKDVNAGVLLRYFEEEYAKALESMKQRLKHDLSEFPLDEPEVVEGKVREIKRYLKYLESDVSLVHRGYFATDKAGSKSNSDKESNKIEDYDLILKDKERLLSLSEPTRFIFSHSALREGWDNPNVFQICTLRDSNSTVNKRQEIGRGLRLCVDEEGLRYDSNLCGDSVHDINVLTVVVNESYRDFVDSLQKDTAKTLRERITKVCPELFMGDIVDNRGMVHTLSKEQGEDICSSLQEHGYISANGAITSKFKDNFDRDELLSLPDCYAPMQDALYGIINSTFDADLLSQIVSEKPKIAPLKFNKEAYKRFSGIWQVLKERYSYHVRYSSDDLIANAIESINSNLEVPIISFLKQKGVEEGALQYKLQEQSLAQIDEDVESSIKYDLVGAVAEKSRIMRKTAVAILKGISERKFKLFRRNPEKFIFNVSALIREQKASLITDSIEYYKLDRTYDDGIFVNQKQHIVGFKLKEVHKHLVNYVAVDGIVENSVESRFCDDLEKDDDNVIVYAKMPREFQIPTPFGNYTPDWAIVFNGRRLLENSEHENLKGDLFLVAETKGTSKRSELREVERQKIACAKRLYHDIKRDGLIDATKGSILMTDTTSLGDLLNTIFNASR